MKRVFWGYFIAISVLFSGCSGGKIGQFSDSFFDVFDTVTTVKGYAASEAEFRRAADAIHDELLEYHRLFDIYNDYEGVANIKTINDNAGGEAVKVDRRIIELLVFCREIYENSGGAVDITLGPVLALWHEAREVGIDDPENAYVPDGESLREAKEHCGFDKVQIDEEKLTVRLVDPLARLDVGAVAKGFAAGRVCERAPEGYLVSVGGNICATGAKADGSDWVVALENPEEGEGYLATVGISRLAVVSSGDYQRYYVVDGVRYHHIIDPETLFPAKRWRGVSVLCEDSGLADGLSTALFILDLDEGRALAERFGAEAVWVDGDGNVVWTEGVERLAVGLPR